MHLVCRDCTEVIEADLSVAAPFADSLRESFGFDTDMKHFAIFGRCADCSAQQSQQAATPAGTAPRVSGDQASKDAREAS
jgi:Fur family ferric uptake transcriptional regulator